MHRNLAPICKIGKCSLPLMIALATIDLETSEGKALIGAFPHCFSSESVAGPVPLSVLRHIANNKAQAEGSSERDRLVTSGHKGVLHEYNIPYIGFDTWGTTGTDLDLIPDEINKHARFGSIITYQGVKYVVVENNSDLKEFYIAPLTCIDVDL
jgi:hypothetical protein